MPDICMCANSGCPRAKSCRRSPESGTKPNPYWQSWFVDLPYDAQEGCEHFWPVPAACTERGIAAAALARKARPDCKRGHPLSGENLFITSSGGRGCKACRRIHKQAYRERSHG